MQVCNIYEDALSSYVYIKRACAQCLEKIVLTIASATEESINEHYNVMPQCAFNFSFKLRLCC